MDAILTTILTIVVMIFIGYALKRLNIVEETVAPSLNSVVLYVFLPCMIFKGLYTADLSNISHFFYLPVLIIISSCIVLAVSYFILKRFNLDKSIIWAILVPVALSNTGFMGFPINLGVFGNAGFIRALFCDLSTSFIFLMLSFILILIYGGTFKKALKKILFFPPLWAFIIALIVSFSGFTLDPLFENIIFYLADGTVPLIMISLGLTLNFNGFKRNRGILTFASVIKLIIFPLILLIFATVVGLSGLDFKVNIIEAAMPSAMLSMVIATDYYLDYHLTSDIILVTTVLSLITLPVIMYLV